VPFVLALNDAAVRPELVQFRVEAHGRLEHRAQAIVDDHSFQLPDDNFTRHVCRSRSAKQRYRTGISVTTIRPFIRPRTFFLGGGGQDHGI